MAQSRGTLTLKGVAPPGAPPPSPSQRRTAELLERLFTTYPATFKRDEPPVPLAISIREELFAAWHQLPRTAIRQALDAYCRRPAYFRAVVAGAARIGLDGKPSGTVTEEGAKDAAKRLARLLARLPKKEGGQ